MTSISAVAASGAGAAPTPGTAGGLNQLDNTQTFLQLLVAQLKNQDPTNPADPTQFMTEIAQLTAVQSQTTLDAEEQAVAADSMIGRQVSGRSADGTPLQGTVTAVLLSAAGAPELQVGTGAGASDVSLSSVTKVSEPSPTTSGTSTTTSTPTTTSTSSTPATGA